MQSIKKYLHLPLTAFICFVFIQSLFFKFNRSPETVYIFEEKLNPWATNLTGIDGLFAPGGIFSAYVVGSAELIASILLIIGAVASRRIQSLGALLALGIISGAIFFHLFTPLGVEVQNADGSMDGGGLFIMACLVWLSSAIVLLLHRHRQTILNR